MSEELVRKHFCGKCGDYEPDGDTDACQNCVNENCEELLSAARSLVAEERLSHKEMEQKRNVLSGQPTFVDSFDEGWVQGYTAAQDTLLGPSQEREGCGKCGGSGDDPKHVGYGVMPCPDCQPQEGK